MFNKSYLLWVLLLVCSGILAFLALTWPWLDLWLQEIQFVPDGNKSLPYTLPILLYFFVGGISLSSIATKSSYKSIKIVAYLLWSFYIFLVLFVYSTHLFSLLLKNLQQLFINIFAAL